MSEPITARAFHAAEGVEDWRVIGDGACAYFRTGSFAAGARSVQGISEVPGLEDHAADVDPADRQSRIPKDIASNYGNTSPQAESGAPFAGDHL